MTKYLNLKKKKKIKADDNMKMDIVRQRCESAHADWAKFFRRRSGSDLNVHVPDLVTEDDVVT